MKIDKYYIIGYAIWFLYIIFESLFFKTVIKIVWIDQFVSFVVGFIGWIIVMIWIKRKQRKNWRNV